jgi:hypothetical protein
MPMRWREPVDVVVVGGGTAGAIAAIASGRTGARTLLVEQYGQIGGMTSAGMTYLGFLDGQGRQAVRGIPQEVFDRLVPLKAATPHIADPLRGSVTQADPEMLRRTLVAMLAEHKIHLLLHAFLSDVLLDREGLRGVVVETKGGRQALPAKVVVDATGDADVAARAGAPFELGRPEDGRLQPVSRIFRVGNVHLDRAYAYLREHPEEFVVPEGWTTLAGEKYGAAYLEETPGTTILLQHVVRQAQQQGKANLPKNVISIYTPPWRNGPVEVAINATRLHGIDPTDPDQLTWAELECERQVMEVFRFLKTTIPGFEESRLLGTPYQVGVRESRRIVGEYVLTAEDVLRGADFPDAVARGAYPLDIHDVGEGSRVMNRQVHGRAETMVVLPRSYAIPYRSLLPRQSDNLLVAGRCISATHEALSSARGQCVCMATGHAAGTAAALAARAGVPPRRLPVPTLQATLREQGAILTLDETPGPGRGGTSQDQQSA